MERGCIISAGPVQKLNRVLDFLLPHSLKIILKLRQRFLYLAFALLAGSIACTQTGCKEDTIIKAKVAPSAGNLNLETVPDTLTTIAKTIYDDSIITSYTFSGVRIVHGMGTVNDPFYGRTNWGIYMQVVPPAANFDLPNPPDSAYIVLPYSGFSWGDTNNTTNLSYVAYRVTENMYKDTEYYSKQALQVDGGYAITEANSVNFKSLRQDSVNVSGINRARHLRLKLKSAFVNDILDKAKKSTNNAEFLDYVKGIYIRSADTTTGKAVPYFLLDGSYDYGRAAIVFYYHYPASPDTARSAFFSFSTTDCAHYNYITRNYTGSQAQQYFTASQDSVLMLQNEPGAAIDVQFPYLKNLPVSLISQAQLVITRISLASDAGNDDYSIPARIFPTGVDEYGATYSLLDRYPLTETAPVSFIDGTMQQYTVNGMTISQYVINIPREVQKTITNKADNLHLRINGTATFPGAYRMTAGGRSHSMYRVKLNIIYSKL